MARNTGLFTDNISSMADASLFFTPFKSAVDQTSLPNSLCFLIDGQPHHLALQACEELQQHISTQTEFQHNFGLNEQVEGAVIGKMFGVLVVSDADGQLGYLSAFSGKMAGGNHHQGFVPPVFDLLTENSFLNLGMRELSRLTEQIKKLESDTDAVSTSSINELKDARRKHSHALQQQIFEHYIFLNSKGKTKSLNDIFHVSRNTRPPAGAGECAAPKLLQYAFAHQLKPLALAEFWWGLSPKSATWKHGEYYAPCKEKCEPILAWMLGKMK